MILALWSWKSAKYSDQDPATRLTIFCSLCWFSSIWKKTSDPRYWNYIVHQNPAHENFQIFMIRDPKSSKITKLKTLLASWVLLKCLEKSKKMEKMTILWFFMILAIAQRGDSPEFNFWKRLIHECTMSWIWKSNSIFRETTMIFYSREQGKHNFYFFDF